MLTMFHRKGKVAGSTDGYSFAANLAQLLVYAMLGASIVSARPLKYSEGPGGVVLRRGCATHVTEQDRYEMDNGLEVVREQRLLERRSDEGPGGDAPNSTYPTTNASSVLVGELPKVTFDVFLHIIYANETYEGGYVPDDQIQQQMTVLNRDYASTNISWNLVNVTRIHNESWFTGASAGSPQELELKQTYHKGISNALNVFTVGFNSTDRSLGYSSLPSAYLRSPLLDGLLIRYTTLPGGNHTNYNLGRTMVHELGHWLGLYHTFEGGCTGVGDNVDDTAPEASGAEGCPVGRKSCAASKFEDPIHNFMDYSFDSCMTHFTPGQAVRMHEAIWAFRTPRPPVANSTSTAAPNATTSATPSTTSAAPEKLTATVIGIPPQNSTVPQPPSDGAEVPLSVHDPEQYDAEEADDDEEVEDEGDEYEES
ncbi:zincin [Coprinellus micaceus]|uniref:Zincin n=1 Tax=Coprinellus micaceus TaxID=71717 RepID=A0A4Y7SQ89_COPMI|nr:zincin [Coprinellus micaceus]